MLTYADSSWWKRQRELSRRRGKLVTRGRGKRRRRHDSEQLTACLLAVGVLSAFLVAWMMIMHVNDDGSHHRHRLGHQIPMNIPSADPPISIIHVVHTRLMQHQGNLTTLAQARLHLFQTFCLPTMIQQTNQNFVWIIKTDPSLDEDIRTQLVELLQPHANVFLVASLVNYQAGEDEGSWRSGQEGQELVELKDASMIHTGNWSLLQQAYDWRHDVPVLETRLDADDGLHVHFVEHVQQQATMEFSSSTSSSKKWMYWCAKRLVEWYAVADVPEGVLQPILHEKLCVTPGLTVGYNVGTNGVPTFAHDVLYKSIVKQGGCQKENHHHHDGTLCIRLIDELPLVAVRSRTPTSAGMMDATWQDSSKATHQASLWYMMERSFRTSKDRVKDTNHYIQSNLAEIARENLLGQCTKGHSCKQSSIDLLKKLMASGEPKE